MARKIDLVAIFFTLTAFALSSNAIPPLVTTIGREFNVRFETVGGYIILLQFSVFALASLSGGWASHRFGWSNRSLTVVGVLTLGVLLMSAALFPSFTWFLALAVPLGFAGGLVETFSSILVCRFGGSSSSKLLNLSQVFFCFGALFAPFFISRVLALGIPWRFAFFALGMLALVIGVMFTLMTRNLKEPGGEVVAESPTDCEELVVGVHRGRIWTDVLLYPMAGALFLYVVIEGSFVVWIASYFENYLHVSASSAAWRLSVFWLGIVGGRSLMLVLKGAWTLWPAVIVGSLGLTGFCAIMTLRWSPIAATAFIFLAGFLAGPLWPVIVTISQNLRNSGKFTAVVIGAGAMGAGLGPFMSAYVIKRGMHFYFPVLAGLGVLLLGTVLMGYFLSRRTSRS